MPAPKTKPGAAEAEQHNDPDHSTFVVLQMDRSHIDTVLVEGKPVKRGGKLLSDNGEVLAEARTAARRLTAG
jgi:hypothetical protein